MLKRTLMLAALCCAGALFADAVAPGKSRDGYPLVVPQVQKLAPVPGTFALPAKLTAAAPGELDLAPLAKVYAETVLGGSVERAADGALCRFELTDRDVPESPEGYVLAVTDSGICVRARDVRGLYYGMQTLCMLLRNRSAAESLKCCTVTDWPDLEMRGLFLQIHAIKSAQVDRVCHVLDTLGALKYNTIVLTVGRNFPFDESLPFTRRDDALTRADIEKILAAAKRNHMEVIPYIQLVSHAGWLCGHRDWEKFAECETKNPHVAIYCLSNPDIQPVVEKVIRDVIAMMKPRYFHVGLDEIEQCGYPQCPKCKKADLEKLLLDHLRPVWKIFAENGVTPIIAMDQFFGFGEPCAVKGIGIEKLPEKLGRHTVINTWEYGAFPSDVLAKKIRARGFEKFAYMSFSVSIDNCCNLPKVAAKAGALGNIIAHWSRIPVTMDKPDQPLPDFYPSTVAQANYCWNAKDVEFTRIPFDSAQFLIELLDGPRDRAFRGTAAVLPLDGALNRAFAADPVFPDFDAETVAAMKRLAAADPARFDLRVRDGAPLAIVLSGGKYDGFAPRPVTIPVNTTATGASFLVTSAVFNKFVLPTSVYQIDRIRVGELRIVYADGKADAIPLVYLRNLNDWNTFLGGNACRVVLRGNDRNGALFSLYAIDWRNPHPDKEIKEIVFSSKDDTFISPVLFAVSLSDAGSAPAGAVGALNSAPPARRPEVKRTSAVSFANGVPRGTRTGDEGCRVFRCRPASDPERGKVLELSMRGCREFLARPLVDLPLTSPREEFESVIFDLRITPHEAVFRPDFYIMDKAAARCLSATGFFIHNDDRWHTVCIPRSRLGKSGGGIDPGKADFMSIRFFMQQWNKPVSIRIGDISYGDGVLPSRINAVNPTE